MQIGKELARKIQVPLVASAKMERKNNFWSFLDALFIVAQASKRKCRLHVLRRI